MHYKNLLLKFGILLSFITLFLSSVLLPAKTHASTPTLVDSGNGIFFGQNHHYSVIFRGNGEAVVYAKLIINNETNTPLSKFNFEIPRANPSDLTMYQQKLTGQCIEYASVPAPCTDGVVQWQVEGQCADGASWSSGSYTCTDGKKGNVYSQTCTDAQNLRDLALKQCANSPKNCPVPTGYSTTPAQYDSYLKVYQGASVYSPQVCIRYSDPDYNNYYYNEANPAQYLPVVTYQKFGQSYEITLPYEVEPYKTTALIISYSATGYVKNNFGLYSFNFETIKVPSRVTSVRVAVDVDSDLFLKGKASNVNYNSGNLSALRVPAGSGMEGKVLDSAIQNIGSYGAIVKGGNSLSPNESFSVKGEYASSWLRLYIGPIVALIVIVAGIIAGVVFLPEFLRKRFHKDTSHDFESRNTQAPMHDHLSRLISGSGSGSSTILLMSLLSVCLIVGLTYILKGIGQSGFLQTFMYSDPMFIVPMYIAVLLLYVLAIFGPAIFVASKKGWRAFLLVLAAEFMWFLVLGILYAMLFQSMVNTYPATQRLY